MAENMYMKIDGIDGESTDDKHANWFELLSFSHGVSQPVSAASRTGGRVAGKADFQDFTVTKTVDKATPDLNMHCCMGKHINKVEVELCKTANGEQHVYMKYEMENVIVSSVSPGGSSGSEFLETVSFAYGKIKWAYTPIDHAGNASATVEQAWDLETNKQA